MESNNGRRRSVSPMGGAAIVSGVILIAAHTATMAATTYTGVLPSIWAMPETPVHSLRVPTA